MQIVKVDGYSIIVHMHASGMQLLEQWWFIGFPEKLNTNIITWDCSDSTSVSSSLRKKKKKQRKQRMAKYELQDIAVKHL